MKNNIWAGLDLSGTDKGKLDVCNKCGAEIVWLKARNKNIYYKVEFEGLIDVRKNNFHKCKY